MGIKGDRKINSCMSLREFFYNPILGRIVNGSTKGLFEYTSIATLPRIQL